MNAENFVLADYLARIGFVGEARADIGSITRMMRCQLCSVPFENLDPRYGKPVSLVAEDIVDKIVGRRRGGYCYEVNGLFAMALAALGVRYQFVAARPLFFPVRRPKTHMALVLDIDGGRWLVDLGFGSYGIRAPLCLDQLDRDVRQDGDVFRLARNAAGDYLLQAQSEGGWAKQYEFNLSPQEWIDFAPANYLNSTHPDSLFVNKLLVVVHDAHGRKILFDGVLKRYSDGAVEQVAVAPENIAALLASEFGLPATP